VSPTRRNFALLASAALSAPLVATSTFAEAQTSAGGLPERLSDALLELFGSHPGFREIHAKGIVCEGSFTPSDAGATVSRAPHFRNAVPVTIRFSDFSGVPTVPSTDGNASPHGMAIKFHTPAGDTDLVGHSVNAFPGATGDQFLDFIEALIASKPGAPKPTAIERYLQTHPAAMRFVAEMPPPPQSYVTTTYHMINAFVFTNAAGQVVVGRYHILPRDGPFALDPSLVPTRSANYLAEELTTRLTHGPAYFDIIVQIADPSDQTHDGSTLWATDRRIVTLGTLRITHAAANSLAAQRKLLYDPTRLIDGIRLSDDPLPAVRSAAYAISFARRSRA
jgi:catalase